MRLEFQAGEMVMFVQHKGDSIDACEIGEIYTVAAVDTSPHATQPYALEATNYGGWWVATECVAPLKLEND